MVNPLCLIVGASPGVGQAGPGTLLFTGGGLADHHAFTLSVGKTGLRQLVTLLHQELTGTPLRVGTVTIRGQVQLGVAFDSDRIAEAYWPLHAGYNQPLEIILDGAA